MKQAALIATIFTLLTGLNVSRANELITGDWQGSIKLHGELADIAKFKVKKAEPGYKITMYYGERPYAFNNLNIDESTLKFDLDTGSVYACQLHNQTKAGFSGNCKFIKENKTRIISIEMIPPVEEDADEDPEADTADSNDTETQDVLSGSDPTHNSDPDNPI